MKLYRSKVPVIAHECIEALSRDGDIEVLPDRKAEAEADLAAIMEDYLRRDNDLREAIKDHMADAGIPYDQYGKTRTKIAEQRGHPLGDDVERYLVRQFVENLMISPNIDEIYEEDRVIYKKLMDVLRSHDVDEEALREEAKDKIKNVAEGTVEYEIAMRNAVRDVKKRKGLI
jgi:hypothetical protein